MVARKLLNLGCGETRPGPPWLNLDLDPSLVEWPNGLVHDLRICPWPVECEGADGALFSHVLEHFDLQEGLAILRECHRVLVPGGAVRIAVPCARRCLRSAADMALRDFLLWQGHLTIYDRWALAALLGEAGFRPLTAGGTTKVFRGLRTLDNRRSLSVFAEGIK
jgi:hypothetical protein